MDPMASTGVLDESPGDVLVSVPLSISVAGPALLPPEQVLSLKTLPIVNVSGRDWLYQRHQCFSVWVLCVVPSIESLHVSSMVLPAISASTELLGYPYAVTSVEEPEPLGFPRSISPSGSSGVRTASAGMSAMEAGPDSWRPHRVESRVAWGNP